MWSQYARTGLLVLITVCLTPAAAPADIAERDSNGFYGIRWGTNLAEVGDLVLVESTNRIRTYELKHSPPQVGNIPVDQLRFVAIEGQFARVSIRYSGARTHSRMMEYLQSQFGPIERGPGAMLRGLTQQFSWRDQETEANLTYDSYRERGTVFIESRTLAPRFNDVIPDGAF